jgi:hypothetical protein
LNIAWPDYKTNTDIANKLNITPVWTKCRTTEVTGYNM